VELIKGGSADRNAAEKDMQERLLAALAKLDHEQAELLVLWSVHGYTDAQIAEMSGKIRNAVAVALHRAKNRLKEL
jgi:DNA-directed RNA polymerase specialized sigma24 family protein